MGDAVAHLPGADDANLVNFHVRFLAGLLLLRPFREMRGSLVPRDPQ
jgi:hypothetical protein